ncbi:MAG: D-alanine--D-alanine ligase family protein [Patescibacteria group bacterium]
MKQLTVLAVFGGESSEHDVSVNSARNIYLAIDKTKYDVRLCYIDIQGRWWLLDEWNDVPDGARTTQLVIAPGTRTLLTVPGSKVISVDVIFPVLHGKLGEDGTIQGLAEMMHIPIVGCGVESSAICMNKDATKRLVAAQGLSVVPWVTVRRGEDAKSYSKRIEHLDAHGPWFVKPARAGSSVGVSKVATLDDIATAVEAAHRHDALALVEIAVNGRELEVAVLGNPPHHRASGVGEIIPGSDFYDYEDKYSADSLSKTVLNADLPKALTKVIRQHALDAYALLGCTGLARVDFLLNDELVPYLNEINTLPGFTNISMYPKLWQEKGLSQTELVDQLIDAAVE